MHACQLTLVEFFRPLRERARKERFSPERGDGAGFRLHARFRIVHLPSPPLHLLVFPMAHLPSPSGEETPISGWAGCLRSQQPRGVDPHPRTDARDTPKNGPRTVLFQWKTAPKRSMYGPRNPGGTRAATRPIPPRNLWGNDSRSSSRCVAKASVCFVGSRLVRKKKEGSFRRVDETRPTRTCSSNNRTSIARERCFWCAPKKRKTCRQANVRPKSVVPPAKEAPKDRSQVVDEAGFKARGKGTSGSQFENRPGES